MPEENEREIGAKIMAAERTWTVSTAASIAVPNPVTFHPVTPPPSSPMNTEAIQNISSGAKSFWAKMTPKQRSAEISRRRAVTRARRAAELGVTQSPPVARRKLVIVRKSGTADVRPPRNAACQITLSALRAEYQRRLTLLDEVANWMDRAGSSPAPAAS
jgi:hypothetical protein